MKIENQIDKCIVYSKLNTIFRFLSFGFFLLTLFGRIEFTYMFLSSVIVSILIDIISGSYVINTLYIIGMGITKELHISFGIEDNNKHEPYREKIKNARLIISKTIFKTALITVLSVLSIIILSIPELYLLFYGMDNYTTVLFYSFLSNSLIVVFYLAIKPIHYSKYDLLNLIKLTNDVDLK